MKKNQFLRFYSVKEYFLILVMNIGLLPIMEYDEIILNPES